MCSMQDTMTERGQPVGGHITGVVLPSEQVDIISAGVTPLMLACYNGEVRKVRNILQTGYQTIHSVNSYNARALDYAVDNHQVQVVDLLLGYGADLDALNNEGHGILHRCVLTGQLDKVTTCIQIGANLDLRNRNGESALHVAIQKKLLEIVCILIQNACDKTARDQEGFTAIECAFLNDNLDFQRALSTHSNDTGDTLVTHQFLNACSAGAVAQIEAMISTYGEQLVQLQGIQNVKITPVYVASENGHLEVLRTLCRHRPNVNITVDDGNSPLICAAIRNHSDIVRYLISVGARVNFRNILGRTALYCAVIEQNIEVIKILVHNGTLINLRSFDGSTALFIAAQKNSLDMVKYLVDYGALVDIVDDQNITPLLLAVCKNNMGIVQYLIEKGANPEQSGYIQHTPLSLAVKQNELAMVQYLVEHGADIDRRTPAGITMNEYARQLGNNEIFKYLTDIHNRLKQNTGGHQNNEIFNFSSVVSVQQHLFSMVQNGSGTQNNLKILIQKGADLNEMDSEGRTPLITAIVHSHTKHVAWLIHEQVNVNLADSSGCPPLIHAVLVDSLLITELLLKPHTGNGHPTQRKTLAVHPRLSQTGTIHQQLQIDQTDSTGKTALSYCIESQHSFAYEIATKLIYYGTNVNMVDFAGQTILEKSVCQGKSELVDLLLGYGAQLCPEIIIEVCLGSDVQIMVQCIKHLLASSLEMCGPYINLVLNFTAANLFWTCLKTCLNEIHLACTKLTRKEGLVEILNTNTLCQIIKFLIPENFEINCPNENWNNSVMTAAGKGMMELVQIILESGVDLKQRNQYVREVVCLALEEGQYEMVAELVNTSLIELETSDVVIVTPCADSTEPKKEFDSKDIQVEPLLTDLESFWADGLELVYDCVILTFIRNPQPFVHGISRGWPDPVLYFHVAELNKKRCQQFIKSIPHIEMFRIELMTVPHLATLLTSTDRTLYTEQQCSLSGHQNSVRGLCGCMTCVFKDWSTGAYWGLTTADAVYLLSDDDNYVRSSHQLQDILQTACVIKKHYDLKSVNIAALPMEHIHTLRKCDFCLNELVFHGKDSTLLQRKVTNRAPVQRHSEEVQGVVIDVNVSFQDQNGQFYHGAFVVSPVNQNQVFATCGQSGAAVVDTDSESVLGLVVAEQCNYLGHYKHVTFCIRLDHALMKLYEKYNVKIGKFRTLDIDSGEV